MDEVAFQDWPGPPVDINSGNNPWTPAYGYHTPGALLEKDDFIGNPDADYFLHNTTTQYTYLETIQEETSDDLRSDSDVDSRCSPVGWLATDSEDGSVIRMNQIDDGDCDSDREIACPPKRRRQDVFLSAQVNEEDEETSISRSSSLLQFETLEKQCQQESQSPSTFSQFSFDSLDVANARKEFAIQDFSPEYDGDIFRSFADEISRSKQSVSRDSLLYNASNRYSSTDSSDSDTTIDNSRSCDDNLKTWRSFDSLLLASNTSTKKFSSENLSEDSGYGDQLLTTLNNYPKSGNSLLTSFSSSTGNLEGTNKSDSRMAKSVREKPVKEKKNSYVGFGAYDCDVFQNFSGNFGVSYQDLSIFERFDPFSEPLSKSSPLTDAFLRKKYARQLLNSNATGQTNSINPNINIDSENSYLKSAKYSDCNVSHAASVPNLLQSTERSSVDIQDSVVNVYSVPKDLNFIGDFNSPTTTSVAEKNWNLADLNFDLSDESERLESISALSDNTFQKSDNKDTEVRDLLDNLSVEDTPFIARSSEGLTTETSKQQVENDILIPKQNLEETMANYKREGSYTEAMANRVDLSDDENSLLCKKKLPKSPIVNFDRRVLKAISEQSIHSLMSSTASLQGSQKFLDQPVKEKPFYTTSPPAKKYQNKLVAASTPDLNRIEPVIKREKNPYFDDERRKSTQEISSSKFDTTKLEEEEKGNKNILFDGSNDECETELRRKGSIIKSSTSTSGMSDIDDKTLRHSVRSFSGSNGSKGVHFSPVVAEVNWRDDASTSTVTPDRESLYSLNSSSPEPMTSTPKPKLIKPRAQYANTQSRRSVSQPDLSDSESKIYKREFVDSLKNLRNPDVSKSQPDVSKLKRRGSQLIKKDRDGCTVQAYVDVDGVQYKHTHLDIKSLSQSSLTGCGVSNYTKQNSNDAVQNSGSKNSLTSKFPFYQTSSHGGRDEENIRQSSGGKQLNMSAMADEAGAIGDARPKRKNKSGLGGFLQRLASFRLGAKKGQEQKDKLKRKAQGNGAAATGHHSNQRNPNLDNSDNKKPDYIYIPLKGPSPLDNNNSNVGPVSSKPPLPKQPPPRVVHASVKKTHASNHGGTDDRRRRRTIDSASGAVESRDVGRHGHGNASMDGPMGLIETDLDTEVTVITNGANAKARSLLDLGPEPRLQVPQNVDGSQNSSGRPHKSMEFLLDKQNLKVVERSAGINVPYETII